MQHMTVQGCLVMNLALPAGGALRVPVGLKYTTSDPYAVRLAFRFPDEAPVTWFLARELLVDGIRGPVGEGDIRVCPVGKDLSKVRISLFSPEGSARLFASVAPLSAFLSRTEALIPVGEESTEESIEAELATILYGW
ncbi:SsgA family sporulation/cell division regulator [Kitasatospora sp. NPDC036755]|uniref:SsgA family sporulation/cell division regulator n=1 Tax=Kitasatospora sp. NPDC036755 TaxID=3154600 RepID=UPI0033C82178